VIVARTLADVLNLKYPYDAIAVTNH